MNTLSLFPDSKVDNTDPRYDTLVRGFNLRWVGNPEFVEVVGTAEQVQQAVGDAVNQNMRITVRGGGHCYEDFVSDNDGGVIIDLSGLDGVYEDEENDMIVVEGGCTLWNVYSQMYKNWGVTIPGGSCYSVGVGGHVCGGGYGLLSRLHGLTVDYLAGVEVVVVDENRNAQIVTAFKDRENDDLFWAHTGGGGGNFGVITKYFFQDLPTAPKNAWLANVAWDWCELDQAKFGTIVRQYGEFFKQNTGVEYNGLFALLHLSHISAKQIVLTAQYVGDQPELLDEFINAMQVDDVSHVRQLYSVGYHHHIRADTTSQELPWFYMTQTLNGSGPNRRGKYKSAYMREPFPDRQIPIMFKWLTDCNYDNSQALLQVDSYGGQINAVDKKATAAVHRDSILKLQYQTYWTEDIKEGQPNPHLDWIRGFYTEMYKDYPLSDDYFDGCYVNYPDVDLGPWQELYYGDNYSRLQDVKKQWDPHNIFHHRQSIELRPGTG
ncbi:MAG: FAD-binding oxidoreductase [Ardenticatenaceae bacterium]